MEVCNTEVFVLLISFAQHYNKALKKQHGAKNSPRPIFYRKAEIVTFWDTPPVLSKNFLRNGIEKKEDSC